MSPDTEDGVAMLMTSEELHRITGFRQGAKQGAWIKSELGLNPVMGADGRPRLTWAVFEKASLARTTARVAESAGPQPNWQRAA